MYVSRYLFVIDINLYVTYLYNLIHKAYTKHHLYYLKGKRLFTNVLNFLCAKCNFLFSPFDFGMKYESVLLIKN